VAARQKQTRRPRANIARGRKRRSRDASHARCVASGAEAELTSTMDGQSASAERAIYVLDARRCRRRRRRQRIVAGLPSASSPRFLPDAGFAGVVRNLAISVRSPAAIPSIARAYTICEVRRKQYIM